MMLRVRADSTDLLSRANQFMIAMLDKFHVEKGSPTRPNRQIHGFVIAFLLSCGQAILLTLWLFMNQPHWPAALKLLLPIIWFTVVLLLTLKIVDGSRAHPRTPKKANKLDHPQPVNPLRPFMTLDKSTNLQLATVTHELKTPLNAIIGFSEILNREFSASGQSREQEYARLIHQSGRHLLSVVNGILDLSRLQSGTYHVTLEPIAVAPLIETCCKIMQPLADQKSIKLEWQISEGLPPMRADARACRQILLNLLSNAIKFSPIGGRVLVSAQTQKDAPNEAVEILVRDSGEGIKPHDFKRLCQPFIQGEQHLDRGHDGTGIGLAIVEALTQLQDGTLQLVSDNRELWMSGLDGAAISLTLPCWRNQDDVATPQPQNSPQEKAA